MNLSCVSSTAHGPVRNGSVLRYVSTASNGKAHVAGKRSGKGKFGRSGQDPVTHANHAIAARITIIRKFFDPHMHDLKLLKLYREAAYTALFQYPNIQTGRSQLRRIRETVTNLIDSGGEKSTIRACAFLRYSINELQGSIQLAKYRSMKCAYYTDDDWKGGNSSLLDSNSHESKSRE